MRLKIKEADKAIENNFLGHLLSLKVITLQPGD